MTPKKMLDPLIHRRGRVRKKDPSAGLGNFVKAKAESAGAHAQ